MSVARAIGTYLDHLNVERGLAANTLLSYRRDLNRYEHFLGARETTDLSAVTEELVTSFVVSLREGDTDHVPLGSASVARTVVAVRGFHRFAVRDGLSPVDPAAAVRPPTPAKRLPKALTLAEVESILEAASMAGSCRRASRPRVVGTLVRHRCSNLGSRWSCCR